MWQGLSESIDGRGLDLTLLDESSGLEAKEIALERTDDGKHKLNLFYGGARVLQLNLSQAAWQGLKEQVERDTLHPDADSLLPEIEVGSKVFVELFNNTWEAVLVYKPDQYDPNNLGWHVKNDFGVFCVRKSNQVVAATFRNKKIRHLRTPTRLVSGNYVQFKLFRLPEAI